MPDVRGLVEFKDVWFEYNPGVPVLKGVSFRAPAGTPPRKATQATPAVSRPSGGQTQFGPPRMPQLGEIESGLHNRRAHHFDTLQIARPHTHIFGQTQRAV